MLAYPQAAVHFCQVLVFTTNKNIHLIVQTFMSRSVSFASFLKPIHTKWSKHLLIRVWIEWSQQQMWWSKLLSCLIIIKTNGYRHPNQTDLLMRAWIARRLPKVGFAAFMLRALIKRISAHKNINWLVTSHVSLLLPVWILPTITGPGTRRNCKPKVCLCWWYKMLLSEDTCMRVTAEQMVNVCVYAAECLQGTWWSTAS